jgi:hypothetical protein
MYASVQLCLCEGMHAIGSVCVCMYKHMHALYIQCEEGRPGMMITSLRLMVDTVFSRVYVAISRVACGFFPLKTDLTHPWGKAKFLTVNPSMKFEFWLRIEGRNNTIYTHERQQTTFVPRMTWTHSITTWLQNLWYSRQNPVFWQCCMHTIFFTCHCWHDHWLCPLLHQLFQPTMQMYTKYQLSQYLQMIMKHYTQAQLLT